MGQMGAAVARGHLHLFSQKLRAPLPPAGLTLPHGGSNLTGNSVIGCLAVGIGGPRAISSASGSYSGEWRQQYPPVSAYTRRKALCPHMTASWCSPLPSLVPCAILLTVFYFSDLIVVTAKLFVFFSKLLPMNLFSPFSFQSPFFLRLL